MCDGVIENVCRVGDGRDLNAGWGGEGEKPGVEGSSQTISHRCVEGRKGRSAFLGDDGFDVTWCFA